MTFYFRGIIVLQDWREIDKLVRLAAKAARDIEHPIYLEIGARHGGSLLYVAEVLGPRWRYLVIDWSANRPDYEANLRKVLTVIGREGREARFVRGDSHEPVTWKQVRRLLNGEEISLLFIDGDHSLDGVRRDFEDYGRLVRKGGLIAVHDILGSVKHAGRVDRKQKIGTPDVIRYWRHLRESYPPPNSFEIVGSHSGYGIGVVVK